MLEIDGNYGEGGGQIVRTALALSTITQTPIKITNIRKGRSKPGLKQQHLRSIETLKELCNAETNEIEEGSTELIYKPSNIKLKDMEVDIKTAGSISLYLQPLLIPLFFGDKSCNLKIKGGTVGKWAMSVEYFNEILIPHLRKFVNSVDLKLLKRGYFPKGGGEVEFSVNPKYKISKFTNFNDLCKQVSSDLVRIDLAIDLVQHGKLSHISGVSHASKNLSGKNVAERQADSAKFHLKDLDVPINIRVEYSDTLSPGTGIELIAHFVNNNGDVDIINPIIINGNSLGEIKVSAEEVGKKAALDLKEELNMCAPVDSKLADNLVPWLIFGGGFRTTKVTSHTETNVWVVNQFFPDMISIEGNLIYNTKL